MVKVGDNATVQVVINQQVVNLWLNHPVPSHIIGYKLLYTELPTNTYEKLLNQQARLNLMPLLSRIDKMILKEILSPNENKTTSI